MHVPRPLTYACETHRERRAREKESQINVVSWEGILTRASSGPISQTNHFTHQSIHGTEEVAPPPQKTRRQKEGRTRKQQSSKESPME
jgi:hypothetical protein